MIGADSYDAAEKAFSVGKFMEAEGDDRWCFQVIFLLSKNVISLELSELRFQFMKKGFDEADDDGDGKRAGKAFYLSKN